jgi:hypothetical protein
LAKPIERSLGVRARNMSLIALSISLKNFLTACFGLYIWAKRQRYIKYYCIFLEKIELIIIRAISTVE